MIQAWRGKLQNSKYKESVRRKVIIGVEKGKHETKV